jgi:AbrB family looped-hinge helix DNA binding protein
MTMEARLRLDKKGSVLIPALFREMLGVNVGDELIVRIEDDEVRLTTMKKRIRSAQRRVRKHAKQGISERYSGRAPQAETKNE